MRSIVVGAGPIGLYCAISLARRGDEVLVVDRDPGPPPGGTWDRKGVMQFRHPHAFRPTVRQILADGLDDVWEAVVAAGGVPVGIPGAPDGFVALHSRRSTFELAFRGVAAAEPGITFRVGHADDVSVSSGRVAGVVVDGSLIEADRVIASSGRSTRFGERLRGPGEGGPCGFSYVARMYRALPGGEIADSPFPVGSQYRGYLTIVFPQDDQTESILFVRPSNDDVLAMLRDSSTFQRATQAIPHLAAWTDPERFAPITPAMAGGGLTNTYRGQWGQAESSPLADVYFVGDAVSTTNPAAGRGISLGLRQAQALMGLLADPGLQPLEVSAAFDAWTDANIRPWYLDHVYWDRTLLHRLAGGDIDVDARIPSDVVSAAAEVDPSIGPAAMFYNGMVALPDVLDPFQERTREILRTGWRPRWSQGPTRDELADVILGSVDVSEGTAVTLSPTLSAEQPVHQL